MRRRPILHGRSLATLAILAALLAPARALAKKVSVEWKEIKGAVQYEIQVERDGKAVVKKTFDETAWSGSLEPGIYTYQVRAYDKVKRPGKWSDPKALVVMPPPPEPSFPPDGRKVVLYSPKAGTVLKWAPAKGIAKYLVDVKRGSRTIFNGTVKEPELALKGLAPGDYTWQVTPVVEPGGRAPASLQGRKWEGKPSEPTEFAISHGKLDSPVPVSPVGVVDPPSGGTMKFKWKAVEGAEAYEVELITHSRRKRKPARDDEGEAPNKFITRDNSLIASVSEEGTYTWKVKALANLDPRQVPDATSAASAADFKVDRNASYYEGAGYVAFSTMIAPYTYTVISPSTSSQGSADSAAITLRLSGEYWFRPQWGVGAGLEDTLFQIGNSGYSRKTIELVAKYRMKLDDSRFAWSISPKAGLELRDWFEVEPNPAQAALASQTIGPSVGVDVRKQFTDKFSLGAKFSYYYPMAISGDSSIDHLTGDASHRNLSFGLQGFYWLDAHWGAGAGAYIEHRSISYGLKQPSTPIEQVYMDGTYFFGSILYSFGH